MHTLSELTAQLAAEPSHDATRAVALSLIGSAVTKVSLAPAEQAAEVRLILLALDAAIGPDAVTHYGPDPGHGGLTLHKGARETCLGPDCGPGYPCRPEADGPPAPAPATHAITVHNRHTGEFVAGYVVCANHIGETVRSESRHRVEVVRADCEGRLCEICVHQQQGGAS